MPSYDQVNLSVSHVFDLPYSGAVKREGDIANLPDEIHVIRSQTGVGVFAPAFRPRRSFFVSLRKDF